VLLGAARGLFEDSIFVFTPQGRVIDLPAGARLTARATMDSTADFDVYVYNSVGSLIGASELSTGLTDTVAVTNSSTGTLRRYVEVRFFDGHPDGYLTHGTLSEKNERGGVSQGGGFKNFRPIHIAHGAIVQSRNRELTDYGGTAPFDRSRYQVQGQAVSFHAWLKSQLALPVSADLMTTGSGS